MNKIAKLIILAASSLAAISAPIASAHADSWGRHGWNGGGRYYSSMGSRHDRSGDAIAAGIIGLAAGAIVGSVLSQPQTVYVEPGPTYAPPPPPAYYPPQPAYRPVYGGYEPWSRGWYDSCSVKYRSFNPNTGTYRGYDGQDHFCTLN